MQIDWKFCNISPSASLGISVLIDFSKTDGNNSGDRVA